VTNDTTALQLFINSVGSNFRLKPGLAHVVDKITLTGSQKILDFSNVRIIGLANAAQDCIIDIVNLKQSKIKNLFVVSDGRSADGNTYHLNYQCAVRMRWDGVGDPCQYTYIDGLIIKYIKDGFVYGTNYTQDPQARVAQSENYLNNYWTMGVLRPLTINAINCNLQTTNCCLVANRGEADPSWFDDLLGYVVNCKKGGWVSVNDEFVRIPNNPSIDPSTGYSAGYAIVGSNYAIAGAHVELNPPLLISKQHLEEWQSNVSLRDFMAAYKGSLTSPFAVIESGLTGTLKISNAGTFRSKGTAGGNGAIYIDAKNAPLYKIQMADTYITEWNANANNSSALFVRGGDFTARNTTLDNTSGVIYIPDAKPSFPDADVFGFAMSTTQDGTSKGGWAVSGGTSPKLYKTTTDTPSGIASAIVLETSTASLFVETPGNLLGFPVVGGNNYQFKTWFKIGSSDFVSATYSVKWFDFAGVFISQSDLFAGDMARMTSNGFDKWQIGYAIGKSPLNAVKASFQVKLNGTSNAGLVAKLLFTGVTLF
jgi:hypothetical protein